MIDQILKEEPKYNAIDQESKKPIFNGKFAKLLLKKIGDDEEINMEDLPNLYDGFHGKK